MRRGWLDVGSAVSLGLAAVLLGLWLHSYENWRLVSLDGAAHLVVVEPDRGVQWIWRASQGKPDLFEHGPTWLEVTGPRGHTVAGALGSAVRRGSLAPAQPWADGWFVVVRVPYWMLVLPACALPCAWLLAARRRRARSRRGLCAACGYDLRASAGRCPECGRASGGGGVAGAGAATR